jgi:hypothetical protein
MREDIRKACQTWEVVAMELFASNGWRFNVRDLHLLVFVSMLFIFSFVC